MAGAEHQSRFRRTMFSALMFVLLMFSGALMTAQTRGSTGDTGIEGTISISPTHGGPSRAEEPGSAPLRDIEFVVRKGEETIATFKTDAEGKFRVSVPPGHYTVSRANWNARIGSYGPFEVEVVPDRMAKVQWSCDTGVR
jgi:Prealbumin-like fold domain